jgi:molecular chaperone DnaK
MKNDAQQHSEEDKKRREEIDLRNQADALVYSTEKQLSELGDKLSATDKDNINAAKDKLAAALKDNPDNIRTAMDELNKIWSDASTRMYQNADQTAGAQNAGTQDGSDNKKDDTVEEAEYTVVDDDKK